MDFANNRLWAQLFIFVPDPSAERRDRTFFRLGIDSAAVLIVYLGGLVLLYTLR